MQTGQFSEGAILSLAKNAYRSGEAGFSLETRGCALPVIDMQDEFLRPKWTPHWIREATRQVPRIKRLIEYCRLKNFPVIFAAYSQTHKFADPPRSGPNAETISEPEPRSDIVQQGTYLG
jgi:nicotinamidase-related amidase